ncbi:multidrug and toxin extrusion protein 2-like isoform 9-T9 [Megaptera novaeangliae]
MPPPSELLVSRARWADGGWSSANSCCCPSVSRPTPPPGPPRARWRAAPPRPAGRLRCQPAPQPWQGPRGRGQVRGAWALTRCVSELRQPQQEARGSHPAAGRAGAAALLPSLLGALPQHPAHPAALQAGPGRVQAGPGVRACLHPSAPGKFSLQPAGQISAKSGHHVAPSPQRRRGQLRQRAGQLHPGFCAGPGGQFTQAVFLLLCIVKKKLHLDTWAGLLSVLDLSAQAIIYEVATVVYMIPMGLSIAVCFRVGTALGAADTVQAKRSAVSGTLCTVGTSLVVGTVLSLLRNKLGHIFTNDEEVVALVSKVLPLYVVFHLFEAVCGGSQGVDRGSGVVSEMQRLLRDPAQCLYGGVLRGTGRQAFGAVVNAVAYYVVGLPLGAVLTFVVGLGITGTWSGGRRGPRAAIRRSHCPVSCRPLAGHAGLCLPGRRGLRHLHRLDGLEARRGGVVWNLRGVPVCDHVLLGLPGTAEAGVDSRPTGRLRLLQVQKRVGLPPQATESAAPSLRPGPERAVVSSVATGSYPGVTLTMYSRPEAHLDLFGTPEAAQPLPAPPGRLSAKQLAIRRGAALGAATGTLVVGLVIRVLAARP